MTYSDARSELWLPGSALASCVRGVVARDTLSVALEESQRYNRLPAVPTCTLLWYLQGECHLLAPGAPAQPHSPRTPIAAATLCGPFTRPTISWNPGPMHAFSVLLMPDALAHMTGLGTAALLDRIIPAQEVFDAEWQAMFAQVAQAADDEQRVALVESFLLPRWQQSRPASALHSHLLTDWSRSVALRAASSGLGRSLRQAERRIKQWTGQTQRNLHGLGRSERAFFEGAQAHQDGAVRWGDIADASGYADQSHMCRESRRITGYAPGELYRLMQRDESFWAYRLWAFGVSASLD
ncbi:AraC family transcriptional regulator [Acidovorax sp. D2M1]|uniref:AraC family transcriptional regulator n=1 Tax=Acidovorax benzenivorans TaxID=2987520 RepID=A0ABT5S416_9BURK|nr:AraC family transcriptional regulator [Acidovorax benzenivorans]MDD2180052.1 AraC family transcriptional regulator [Acidovorax benzenivorans]